MSVLRAAGLIAFLSLVSKFIGLARDKAFAYYCGLSAVNDAYNASYLIPGVFGILMLGGLNGPFHSAIVSTLTKAFESEDKSTFRTVLWTVILLTTLVMGGLSLALYFFASPILSIWKLPTETHQLAVIQFQIMSPMFLIAGYIGIAYGVLSLRKQFATPTLSPIMASMSIILALMLFAPADNPEYLAKVLAYGTLIGACFQLLFQFIPLMGHIHPWPLRFQMDHPTVKTLLTILIPAVLSSSVGQVNSFIIQFFTGSMVEGAISAFQLANRLIQLPLGILLTALLVPLLPVFTQAATENDQHSSLIQRLNQGLRPVLLLSVPVTVLLIIFGRSAVAFLFEGGRFGPKDTFMTYQILVYLSLSIVIYAIRDVLVRVFYALQNSKIPFYTTFVSIVMMFVFSVLLAPVMMVSGIALAASLATLFNFLTLGFILQKSIGQWIENDTWKHLRNILLAIVPMSVSGYWIYQRLLSVTPYKIWLLGESMLWASVLGASYLGVLWLLKDPELSKLGQLFERLLARLPFRSARKG